VPEQNKQKKRTAVGKKEIPVVAVGMLFSRCFMRKVRKKTKVRAIEIKVSMIRYGMIIAVFAVYYLPAVAVKTVACHHLLV
jgi:hypothetical protein